MGKTKSELESLKYSTLLMYMYTNNIIDGIDIEINTAVSDSSVSVERRNGVRVWRKQGERSFDFIIAEGISRLASKPHITKFAKDFCNGAMVIPTEFKDRFDFTVGDHRIEAKVRSGKYTYDYFIDNGVMVDLTKQDEATILYTQSSDGYGLFFSMNNATATADTVSRMTTTDPTGELVHKDRAYFDVTDAIAIYSPEGERIIPKAQDL